MPDYSRKQLLKELQERDLQSEAVKDCAESVKRDNPDMSEERAFAICQAQENKGNLEDVDLSADLQEDDPCWENYVMVGTKIDENGNEVPNCVPEEDADAANLGEAVVEAGADAILRDNPGYSRNRAMAISHAMQNKGELAVSDNAGHDELLAAAAKKEKDCPEGQVFAGNACVDVEDVDVPPGLLASAPRVLAHRELAGPIERKEQSDGSVRYTNIKLLSHGVWTDQNSKQPTEYIPSNLSVETGATVNIAHDDDNEISAVGAIDAESANVEDGDLYADIVLHRDNAASEYADENLQKTLETNGQKGFGGPSVEIPPEGLVIEEGGELGYPSVEDGKITGLGLVKNPASKPTAFDTQTRERAVAMSSGQTDKALVLQQRDMRRKLMDVDEMRETLDMFGFDGLDEMTDDEVAEMAEDLHDDLMEQMEMAEHGDEEEDDEEEQEMGDYGDDEDEEEDEDMEMNMAELSDRLAELESEMDTLKNEMLDEQAMSEELSEAKEELAAADTVAELQEAKEELEKRLSDLENEEKPTKTLAEGGEGTTGDKIDFSSDPGGVDYNHASGSTTR